MILAKVVSAAAVMSMISLVFFSNVCKAEAPDPWLVIGSEHYYGQVFFLESSLIVMDGGSLTLENCTVEFSDLLGEYDIELMVSLGGSLSLVNCTFYGSNDTDGHQTFYGMKVYGNLNCSQCTFDHLRGDGLIGGIQIYSNDVIVAGCLVRHCQSTGIYVRGVSPLLSGNVVEDCVYGFYVDGVDYPRFLQSFSDGNASRAIYFNDPTYSCNFSVVLPNRCSVLDFSVTIECPYTIAPSPYSPFRDGLAVPKGLDYMSLWSQNNEPTLFVADKSNGIVGLDTEGNVVYQLPLFSDNEFGGDLVSPVDIAVQYSSSDGLFILDNGHIDSFRTSDGVYFPYLEYLGIPGTFLGKPVGISANPNMHQSGALFVADSTKGLLDVWSQNVYTTGLSKALDVSNSFDRVFVLDSGSHIDVFSMTTQPPWLEWSFEIAGNLSEPTSVDVYGDCLYVADAVDGLVVLDLDGNKIGVMDEPLLNPGKTAGGPGEAYVLLNNYEILALDSGGLMNPSLDIGADGDSEWSETGEFWGSYVIGSFGSDALEELQSHVNAVGIGDSVIDVRVSSESRGVMSISDLAISYLDQPFFSGNWVFNNDFGAVFRNVSSAVVDNLACFANDYGIVFDNASLLVRDSRAQESSDYDIVLLNGSEPVFFDVEFGVQKVLVTGGVDTDSDGLSDWVETCAYLTDPYLNDTDCDGFNDGWEVENGCDPLSAADDGIDVDADLLGDVYELYLGTDPSDSDTDADGLLDGFEYHVLSSDPLSDDTDSDSIPDGLEYEVGTSLLLNDSDSDGLHDGDELLWDVDSDLDGLVNAMDSDSDDDGIEDGNESLLGTDPLKSDTDSDGILDGAEDRFWASISGDGPCLSLVDVDGDGYVNILDDDSDGDGLLDGREIHMWGDLDADNDSLVCVLDCDSDNDGVMDSAEFEICTSPIIADSDSDGVSDSAEEDYGLNPVDPDCDGDGLSDGDEIQYWLTRQLDPRLADSDHDGFLNVLDIDSDDDGFPDGWECINLMDPLEKVGYATPPLSLTAQPRDSAVFLSWSPPNSTGGYPIDGYIVYGGSVFFNESVIGYTDPDERYFDHVGLQNSIAYYYMVSAFTYAGEGLCSDRVPATPALPPSEPRNLSATSGMLAIELSWEEPIYDGGSQLTGFSIYRSNEGVVFEFISSVAWPLTSFIDDTVRAEIPYHYRVSAFNPVGEGPLSEEVVSEAMGNVPSEPLNLTTQPDTDRVTLFWCRPLSDGGYDDLTYNVYRRTSSGTLTIIATTDIGELSYEDTSAVRWEEYYYAVSASTIMGEGPMSSEVEGCANSLPYFDDFTEFDISEWSVVIHDIIELDYTQGYLAPPCLYMSTPSFGNANLLRHYFEPQRDNLYLSFNVMFTNESDEYAKAYVMTSVAGILAEEDDLSFFDGFVWHRIDTLMRGHWYEVIFDIDIISHSLDFYLDGTKIADGFPTAEVSEIDYVTFYNRWGLNQSYLDLRIDDLYLDSSIAIPDPPQNLSASGGVESIALAWDAPSRGSPLVLGYNVYRWSDYDDKLMIATTDRVQSYIDEEVTPGISYHYELRAFNAVGESNASDEAIASLAEGTVPSSPRNLAAIAISKVGILLNWTVPEENGGLQIQEYRIYRSLTSDYCDLETIVSGSTLAWLDRNVSSQTRYYYWVSAANAAGEGPFSNMASAKAPRISRTVSLSSLPATQAALESLFLSTLSVEFESGDEDGDGILNVDELGNEWSPYGQGYPTSPYKNDTDGDELTDFVEIGYWNSIGVNPLEDSDGDGLPNLIDPDSDNDGLCDGREWQYCLDRDSVNPDGLLFAPGDDYDCDGLPNILDSDSDDDGLLDGNETIIIAGGNIDQVLVFSQVTSAPQQQTISVSVPLDENGDLVPLGGGMLNLTGVQSGGGLFGDMRTWNLAMSNISDVDGGDLDGDGTIDAVVCSETGVIAILYNEGNLTFEDPVYMLVGGKLSGICTGDFDSDGMLDIAVCNYDNGTMISFFGESNRSFDGPYFKTGFAAPTDIFCDVRPGASDYIYIANSASTYVSALLSVAPRGSFVSNSISVASYNAHPRVVKALRLTEGGSTFYCIVCPSEGIVFLKVGSTTRAYFFYTGGMYPSYATFEDLDGDGCRDMVFSETANSRTGVLYLLSNGAPKYINEYGNFLVHSVTTGVIAYAIAAADINSDGLGDLICPSTGSNPTLVTRFGVPYPGTTMTSPISWATLSDPRSVFVSDFNGDGIVDVMLGHYGQNGLVSVHPNGMFPKSPSLLIGGREIWSHDDTFNDSVSASGVYEELLDYLEDNPWICDASDGCVDGSIMCTLVFQTLGPGCLNVYSPDIGTYGMTGYRLDPFNNDVDGDGLFDGTEVSVTLTDPTMPDTDGDGMEDMAERDYWNSLSVPLIYNPDGDAIDNLLRDPDSDDDALCDYEEIVRGSNPLDVDTDDDGIVDYYDRSPDSWSDSLIDWKSLYEPGMLRVSQNISTLYYPYMYSSAEIWDWDYSLITGEMTGDPECIKGPLYDTGVVRTRAPTNESIWDMIAGDFPDYEIMDIEYLGESPDWTSYMSFGGGDWLHQTEYRFYYGAWNRIDRVTLANKNATPMSDGQMYGLLKISVIPGVDQSVNIQVRVNNRDITYTSDRYTVLPSLSYSLFPEGDFLSCESFYSMMSTGTPLGNSSYEFNLRIPGNVATSSNCHLESNGKYSVILYLAPRWITLMSGGITSYTPMDPATLTIGSFVETIPDRSYGLYVRQRETLESVMDELPEDCANENTGTYYFGEYKVYLLNLNNGDSFNQAVVEDDSYDATLIVGRSVDDVLRLQDEIDWCSEDEDWSVFTDQGYGLDKRFNKLVGGILKKFDLTQRSGDDMLLSLDVAWESLMFDSELLSIEMSVLTAEYSDGLNCFHYRSTSSYTRLTVVEDDVVLTVEELRQSEEIVIDLDSKMGDSRYAVVKPLLKRAGVGTVFVTYGYGACLAAIEGDYVRATTYALEGSVLVYGVVKNKEVLYALFERGGKEYALTYGKAATIAAGIIEVGYCAWRFAYEDDEIMRLYYLEKASATVVDVVIFISPVALWATLFLGTLMALSLVLPDPLAKEICSTPGSLVVFWFEYLAFGDESIPSAFCNVAYNEASSEMIDKMNERNSKSVPTRVILPE